MRKNVSKRVHGDVVSLRARLAPILSTPTPRTHSRVHAFLNKFKTVNASLSRQNKNRDVWQTWRCRHAPCGLQTEVQFCFVRERIGNPASGRGKRGVASTETVRNRQYFGEQQVWTWTRTDDQNGDNSLTIGGTGTKMPMMLSSTNLRPTEDVIQLPSPGFRVTLMSICFRYSQSRSYFDTLHLDVRLVRAFSKSECMT